MPSEILHRSIGTVFCLGEGIGKRRFLRLRRQGLVPHYFLQKQEVDFYWENGIPLNVCLDFSAPETRQRELKGMLQALQALDLPTGTVLTRDQHEDIQVEGRQIAVRAAWRYFLYPEGRDAHA